MTMLPPESGESNSPAAREYQLPSPWTEPYTFRPGREHGLTTAQLDEFPTPVLAQYMLGKCALPLFVDSATWIVRNAFGFALPPEHKLSEALETLVYDPRVIPTGISNLGARGEANRRKEILKVVQSPDGAIAYNSIAGSVQDFLSHMRQPGLTVTLKELGQEAEQLVPRQVLDVVTPATLGRIVKTMLLSSDGFSKTYEQNSHHLVTLEYVGKWRTPSLPPALLPVEIGEQILSFRAPIIRGSQSFINTRSSPAAGRSRAVRDPKPREPVSIPDDPAYRELTDKIGEVRLQQVHNALERVIARYIDENTITINAERYVEHVGTLLERENAPLTADELAYLSLALKYHERFTEDPQRPGSLTVVHTAPPSERHNKGGRMLDLDKPTGRPRFAKGWVHSVNKKD